MLLDKQNMTRQYIDDYLTTNHLQTHHTIETTSMELLIEFAKIGLGVGCVIKEFVLEELKNGQLIEIPLDIPIHQREIGFTYIKKRQQEKAVRHLLSFIIYKGAIIIMENFIFSLNATIPIFLIIILGWALMQIGLFNKEFTTVCRQICLLRSPCLCLSFWISPQQISIKCSI